MWAPAFKTQLLHSSAFPKGYPGETQPQAERAILGDPGRMQVRQDISSLCLSVCVGGGRGGMDSGQLSKPYAAA